MTNKKKFEFVGYIFVKISWVLILLRVFVYYYYKCADMY